MRSCLISFQCSGIEIFTNSFLSKFVVIGIIALTLLASPTAARADCTLAPGATCEGGPCADLNRPEGHLLYNEDHNSYQVCESGVWKKIWAISDGGCPGGFGNFSGYCYRLGVNMNWADARSQCQSWGSDLATINEGAELFAMNTVRGAENAWIGYTDTATEGTWLWSEASSTYTNWFAGEPNGGAAESCGIMYNGGGGLLADDDCSELKTFICEAPRMMNQMLSGPTGCANIGDLCADGTVFAGYHPITQAHLFIPTTDQGTISEWKTSTGVNDIATDSIHDGEANTNQVVNSTTFPAFKLCKDLGTGGHNDWYLPSQVELYYLWSVRATIEAEGNITNFQNARYWSSTEYNINRAWIQDFTDGYQDDSNKTSADRVRCLRR